MQQKIMSSLVKLAPYIHNGLFFLYIVMQKQYSGIVGMLFVLLTGVLWVSKPLFQYDKTKSVWEYRSLVITTILTITFSIAYVYQFGSNKNIETVYTFGTMLLIASALRPIAIYNYSKSMYNAAKVRKLHIKMTETYLEIQRIENLSEKSEAQILQIQELRVKFLSIGITILLLIGEKTDTVLKSVEAKDKVENINSQLINNQLINAITATLRNKKLIHA